MTIYRTGSPRLSRGEDTGVPNWWYRSAEEVDKASGPGKTKLADRYHGRPTRKQGRARRPAGIATLDYC
jgi:hypothetical protein